MLFTVNQFNWFWQTLKSEEKIWSAIFRRTLVFTGFALGVAWFHRFQPALELNVVGSLTTNVACNLVLGLLLVFRTNSAYDRFVHGRQAWGVLTVQIRNLSREIQVTVPQTDPETLSQKTAFLKLLAAFAIATKLHLRKETVATELDGWLSPPILEQCRRENNPPLQISLWMRTDLYHLSQRQIIPPAQQIILLNQLDRLAEGLTACERILTTPTPPVYVNFLRKLILIYCGLLPFSLVDELNYWVGFAVAAIASVLLGVDEIGSQMDNPFGTDITDLPLDEICDKIIQTVESTISFVPQEFAPTPADSSDFLEAALQKQFAENPLDFQG